MSCEGTTQGGSESGGFYAGGLIPLSHHDIQQRTEDHPENDVAKKEPQLAYAGYVYGTSKRWSFVSRTTPNVGEHMKKLEYEIKETLIPAIVGKNYISDDTRRIFSLPSRLGGLGFLDPCSVSDLEYKSSLAATAQLTKAIFDQESFLNIDQETQEKIMKEVKHKKTEHGIRSNKTSSKRNQVLLLLRS